MSKWSFLIGFVFLIGTFLSSISSHAGGRGPGCVGLICGGGRTFWSDEQRTQVDGPLGLWHALGEREQEMFPNFYRAGGWVGENVLAPALQTAFNPWMQENIWEPMGSLPPDVGPGPFDNIGLIGAISLGKFGRKLGQLIPGLSRSGPTISDFMAGADETAAIFGRAERERLTLALPQHQGGQLFPPSARAAPSWNNRPSATVNRDLIRRINYANPRHAAIQLQRMIDTPEPFNFVIVRGEARLGEVIVGEHYELLVAPHRSTRSSLINELGIKHLQLANGREIFFGGTMKATRNEQGWAVIEFTNNTGTYGPNIQITPERLKISRGHIYEAFGYQVDDVIFKLFVPYP